MLGLPDGVDTPEELNVFFLDVIREVIGPSGTALVPTYSYTFGSSLRSEPTIYDPESTPAMIGPFPEYFRQQHGVIRSEDPMVSVAGLGPESKGLFSDLPPSSYGKDCLFARLVETSVKCCNIGLGPNWTPFIHYADYAAQVPFRYSKLFYGYIRSGGELRELTWEYSVRALIPNATANAHRLGRLAAEAGIWHHASLGRGRVFTCKYADYFHFTRQQQCGNPWITALGPPCDVISEDDVRTGAEKKEIKITSGNRPIDVVSSLCEIRRELVSDEMSAAFDAIEKIAPVKRMRLPTGCACMGMTIPEKWRCRHAELTTEDGNTIFKLSDHPLHVQSHSLSFTGLIDRNRLLKHLHVNRRLPAAIPHREAYVRRDWALCCNVLQHEQLTTERYRVIIDTTHSYGMLEIGEITAPGTGPDTILLCAYLDGPMQANYGLSGVAVLIELARRALQRRHPQQSYRMLILPGPIGLAAWATLQSTAANNIIGALDLRMLGHRLPHRLMLSARGDSLLDKTGYDIFRSCMKPSRGINDLPKQGDGEELVVPTAASLEAVLNIPVLSIARTHVPCDREFPYAGYRTSMDNLSCIDATALEESIDVIWRWMCSLEMKK